MRRLAAASRPRLCMITVGVATVSTLYMLHRSIKYRIEVYNNMNVACSLHVTSHWSRSDTKVSLARCQSAAT